MNIIAFFAIFLGCLAQIFIERKDILSLKNLAKLLVVPSLSFLLALLAYNDNIGEYLALSVNMYIFFLCITYALLFVSNVRVITNRTQLFISTILFWLLFLKSGFFFEANLGSQGSIILLITGACFLFVFTVLIVEHLRKKKPDPGRSQVIAMIAVLIGVLLTICLMATFLQFWFVWLFILIVLCWVFSVVGSIIAILDFISKRKNSFTILLIKYFWSLFSRVIIMVLIFGNTRLFFTDFKDSGMSFVEYFGLGIALVSILPAIMTIITTMKVLGSAPGGFNFKTFEANLKKAVSSKRVITLDMIVAIVYLIASIRSI